MVRGSLLLLVLVCILPPSLGEARQPETCAGGDPASGGSLLQTKKVFQSQKLVQRAAGSTMSELALCHGAEAGTEELKDLRRLPRTLDTDSGRNRSSLLALGVRSATAHAVESSEINEFVSRHNLYRCMHGVAPVKWSAAMAHDAYKFVWNRTEMEHSDSYNVPPPAGPAGENLAFAHYSNILPKDAVDAWYDEVWNCKTGDPWSFTDGCKEGVQGEQCAPGVKKMTGHFTAMIWDGAKEIGCAYSDGEPLIAICRIRAGDTLSEDTPNMVTPEGNFKKHVPVRIKTANDCWAESQPPPPALPAFPPPFTGPDKVRYVRIFPQTWHQSLTLRAAVLVGDDLTLINPPEERRSYSSVKAFKSRYLGGSDDGHPGSANGKSMVHQIARHAWTARHDKVGEWMQIDLGKDMDVRGVLIEGCPWRFKGCPYVPDKIPHTKSLKIQTATSDDPTAFKWRDDGKIYDTSEAKDGVSIQIVFDDMAPTPEPTPAPPTPPPTPVPPVDCSTADETVVGNGASYRGCQTKTELGFTCQPWASQTPHAHTETPQNYPEAGLAENYCRNPDGSSSIWCWTTDAFISSDYCLPLGAPSSFAVGTKNEPAGWAGFGGSMDETTTSSAASPSTSPDDGKKPACEGDAAAFDAGFGGCAAYAVTSNEYCGTDTDSVTGLFASDVCAECGKCVSGPDDGGAASGTTATPDDGGATTSTSAAATTSTAAATTSTAAAAYAVEFDGELCKDRIGKRINGKTLEECAQLCTDTDGCGYFSYRTRKGGKAKPGQCIISKECKKKKTGNWATYKMGA